MAAADKVTKGAISLLTDVAAAARGKLTGADEVREKLAAMKLPWREVEPPAGMRKLIPDGHERGVYLKDGRDTVYVTPNSLNFHATIGPDGETVMNNASTRIGFTRDDLKEAKRLGVSPDKLTAPETMVTLGRQLPDESFKNVPKTDKSLVLPLKSFAMPGSAEMDETLSLIEQVAAPRAGGKLSPIARDRLEAAKDRMRPLRDQGLNIGAENWYLTRQLLDRQSPEDYMDWTYRDAVLSPQNSPLHAIRQNSLLNWMEKQGIPLTMENLDRYVGKAGTDGGYGSIGFSTGAERVRSGYEVTPEQQKVFSYLNNLRGNLAPGTMDTHMNKSALGIDLGSNDMGVQKNWYAPMEDAVRELSDEVGLPTAAGQSSIWVGGYPITGTGRQQAHPTYYHVLEQAARIGAQKRGIGASGFNRYLDDVLRGENYFKRGGLVQMRGR